MQRWQQLLLIIMLVSLVLFIILNDYNIKSDELKVAAMETTNEPLEKVIEIEKVVQEETTIEVVITEELIQREITTEVLETESVQEETIVQIVETEPVKTWNGPVLNRVNGRIEGPSGTETYYNLDMTGVIAIMQSQGYNYEYSVRADGVKMYGPYIMVAANLNLRPRGTIVETSLGTGIVCDTGQFAYTNPTQLDIAVNW